LSPVSRRQILVGFLEWSQTKACSTSTKRHDRRLLRFSAAPQRPDFSNQNAYDLAQLDNYLGVAQGSFAE